MISHFKGFSEIDDVFLYFRCTDSTDRHLVYIANKEDEFPSVDNPTMELQGKDNIVSFADLQKEIVLGAEYKWRVDCVEGKTDERRQGDTWLFTMN